MTVDPAPAAVPARALTSQVVLAGVMCAVVGFTSSFAVVLAGLYAMGATDAQAASGLLVVSLTMGLGGILFSWRTRMPITLAWSTSGAAMLASAAVPGGGFSTAVGAFMVCGVLLTVCGLVPALGGLIQRLPAPLASAMLAGVLLPLVTAPIRTGLADPWAVGPPVLVWLLVSRLAPRWSAPAALAAAVVIIALRGSLSHLDLSHALPRIELVSPTFHPGAVLTIALPLFLVTMTSQNIPGIAVLGGFGYRPDVRGPLTYAGAASIVGAPGGAHAINLAAISAAIAAGPEAGPDPRRRWPAGVVAGVGYMVLGLLAGLVTAIATAAPHGLLEAVAGLGLVATFASALQGTMSSTTTRLPAAATVIVGASGLVIGGIGAAFWSLVAGLALHAVLNARRASQDAAP